MTTTEPTSPAEDAATASPALNEQGFAMHGDYPLNGRLRAEALATAGLETDPDGMIGDDLIADAAGRLERQRDEDARIAAEQEKATPSLRWTREELAAEADRRRASYETDANKAAILDAINAAPSANQEA